MYIFLIEPQRHGAIVKEEVTESEENAYSLR